MVTSGVELDLFHRTKRQKKESVGCDAISQRCVENPCPVFCSQFSGKEGYKRARLNFNFVFTAFQDFILFSTERKSEQISLSLPLSLSFSLFLSSSFNAVDLFLISLADVK